MTHQANWRRMSDEGLFEIGSKAYLSSSSLRFPDSVSSSFILKYIGPYEITAASPSTSTYTLALPPHLRIHSTFHASKLRPHYPNDDKRFPARSFAQPPPVVVNMRVRRKTRQFKVRYLGYSAAEDDWHSEGELKETAPEELQMFLATRAIRDMEAPARGTGWCRLAALLPDASFSRRVGVRGTPPSSIGDSSTRSASTSTPLDSRLVLTSLVSTNRFAVLQEDAEDVAEVG
ncbi:hypothetical protein JCM10295v2_006278 [Rhodotorula toruloides]